MTRAVGPERIAPLRAAAQLLHRPRGYAHPADVARHVCGAQAQELAAGRLAFRARGARLTAAGVDRARTEERSLLRTWAMRQTVHLLATEDAGWLLPLFEPAVADNSRRRLAELGVEPRAQQRALREVRRSLEADGPLTRAVLAERIERRGIALDVSTRMHVFRLAVASGMACMGPDGGRHTCLVLREEWLGEPPAHDRDAALAELARRYLGAFGPATEDDFAHWSGLGVRAVRSALASIGPEVQQVVLGAKPGWSLRGSARRPRSPVVRLLPAWDTYLMGYRDRGFMAPPERWRRIMVGGGILRPAVVVDGVATGTWRLTRSGPHAGVELDPFPGVEQPPGDALAAEIADVERFEGRR